MAFLIGTLASGCTKIEGDLGNYTDATGDTTAGTDGQGASETEPDGEGTEPTSVTAATEPDTDATTDTTTDMTEGADGPCPDKPRTDACCCFEAAEDFVDHLCEASPTCGMIIIRCDEEGSATTSTPSLARRCSRPRSSPSA